MSTVYGSSADLPGYSPEAAVGLVQTWYGMHLFRASDPNAPATWADSKGSVTPAGMVCWYSFRCPCVPIGAGGAYNKAMYDFVASIPTGQAVWLALEPEPEVQGYTASQWVALQGHFFDQVDQVLTDTGRTDLLKTTILQGLTTVAASGRTPDDWYVSRADLLGFDAFDTTTTGDVAAYAATKSKPWGLAAFSAADPNSMSDAALSTYLSGAVSTFAGYSNPPEAVAYYEAVTSLQDYRLTPDRPTATSTFAATVSASPSSGATTATNTGGTGTTTAPDTTGNSNVAYTSTPMPETQPDSGWSIIVRDYFDPTQVITQITDWESFTFTDPLADIGTGEVIISRDNPMCQIYLPPPGGDPDDGRRLLFFPFFICFNYNGAEQFRMLYDGRTRDRETVDKAAELSLSGSGLSAMLEWGVVLPYQYPTNDKARTRQLDNTAWADLWLTLFREAKARGEIPDWFVATFTRDTDSLGQPWAIMGDREVDVGDNVLSILQTWADAEQFDWHVGPHGSIFAAPELGNDVSSTVRFFPSHDVQEIVQTENRQDIRTRIYLEGVTGRISQVDSSLGTARWGTRAMYVRSDQARTVRQRLQTAWGTVHVTRRPTREKSIKVPFDPRDPVTGARLGLSVFVDYKLGDTIGYGSAIDVEGDPLPSRNVKVQEITVTDSDGDTDLEMMFEARGELLGERTKRLLEQRMGAWSDSKTARTGKPPVSNLRDTDAEFPADADALVFHTDTGLWHNGRTLDVWPFWYVGTLSALTSTMYLTADADRRIKRITARVGTASSSGPVTCNVLINNTSVHTITIPGGQTKTRDLVSIPVYDNDDLSVDIIDPGSGAADLQVVLEAAGL